MSLSKEHTRHNLQAWVKCQLPGWGWHATWPGLRYPALQHCLPVCPLAVSSGLTHPRVSGLQFGFWMHFRISEKLQQGSNGLLCTSGSPHCRAFVGIFLYNCLLRWNFLIRHAEYLLKNLGIVELHRQTGEEFSTPRAVFSPWSVMVLLENAVFPLYTITTVAGFSSLNVYVYRTHISTHINVNS